MNHRSLTLTEIIIVLALLAVLVVSGFVAFGWFNDLKVDRAARKMMLDLSFARSQALSTAAWYGVSFEVNPANLYTVYITDGSTDSAMTDPARLGQAYRIDISDYFSGVVLSGVDIEGGNKVEFSPRGIPHPDLSQEALTKTGLVTLEHTSGAKRTIFIQIETGRLDYH